MEYAYRGEDSAISVACADGCDSTHAPFLPRAVPNLVFLTSTGLTSVSDRRSASSESLCQGARMIVRLCRRDLLSSGCFSDMKAVGKSESIKEGRRVPAAFVSSHLPLLVPSFISTGPCGSTRLLNQPTTSHTDAPDKPHRPCLAPSVNLDHSCPSAFSLHAI